MKQMKKIIIGMKLRVEKVLLFASTMALIAALLTISLVWVPSGSAQGSSPFIWQVQALESDRTGLSNPVGITFSSRAKAFQVLEGQGASAPNGLVRINPFADRLGVTRLTSAVQDPINLTYDPALGRLLLIPGASGQLFEIREDASGNLDPRTLTRHDMRNWGVQQPQGMTVDKNGVLYILDAATPRIVRVQPGLGGNLDAATVTSINLSLASPRGIAYDPSTSHLHVMTSADRKLHEMTTNGEQVAVRDLAQFDLKNPQGMVFAPSGDQTDDPAQMSLFLADGASQDTTGQVVELSLVTPAVLPSGTTLLPASLIRTFNTSSWNNPSPDPGGIEYLPASNQLIITDSEIEESINNNPPAYWHGYNVFFSSLSGSLVGNCTTFTSSPAKLAWNNFSSEPTGVAFDPDNNHMFFTHDGSAGRIYEVNPGVDHTYCTPDDIVTRYNIATLYGATDAEDVTYGNNTLYVSDGTNAEVWVFPLGPDGVISSDDGPVTHWDTAALGFHDLEGIEYNSDTGTLYIVSTQGIENYLGEVSTTGQLLRAYNLSFMGTTSNIRSAVELAPSSQNSSVKSIYIASRGVDNNTNRLENDGKVWEINIFNSPTPTPTTGASSTPTNTPTAGPTPTPTNTPQVNDLIFADDFESGNLSAWSTSVTDGGNLSVTNAAAFSGSNGMQAVINDNTSIYVNDDTPNAEPRYRARFYFNPNSIVMLSGDTHYIFQGYAGTSTSVVRCAFRFNSGAYQIRCILLDDSGIWQTSSWQTITNAYHSIEIDWRAATAVGANDGGLTFWIDGSQKGNLTGIANASRRIDRVALGATAEIDTGTRGTYYFDNFESRRQTYIGP